MGVPAQDQVLKAFDALGAEMVQPMAVVERVQRDTGCTQDEAFEAVDAVLGGGALKETADGSLTR